MTTQPPTLKMKLVVLLLLLCFIVFAEASGCFGCFSKKGKKSKANKGTPSDTPPHEINTSNEQGASTVVSKEENPAEKPEDKDQEVKSEQK